METLELETLEKLEADIDSLRIQYEQYFMGMRKTAPEMDRSRITFLLRRMTNIQSSNYALKFKFQQIVARFNSYSQYWERIQQKLESGQMSRDRLKTVLSAGPVDDKDVQKGKAAETAGSKAAAKPGSAAPADSGDVSSAKIDQIYNQLVESKKALNQTVNVDKEKLGAALKKQMTQLKEKYKDKKMEFEIVVESGQTKIKAKAKK